MDPDLLVVDCGLVHPLEQRPGITDRELRIATIGYITGDMYSEAETRRLRRLKHSAWPTYCSNCFQGRCRVCKAEVFENGQNEGHAIIPARVRHA